MHPKINFPGELEPIFQELRQPLHSQSLRDRKRTAACGTELSLENGYLLEVSDFEDEPHLDLILEDFRTFMSVVMEVAEAPHGIPIRLQRGVVGETPEGVSEAHERNVSAEDCRVLAGDLSGLRRAVFRLEDEMLIRRAPMLPLGIEKRWTTIKTRISRSPVAPYRWLSGWELEDDNDYYPEAYLNRLAHAGVNGLWVPGLLRNLVASKVIPELGPERHRLEKLKQLVSKAGRHGIRIYFFCVEPRGLSPRHHAGFAHPEIVGAHDSLCTSQPLVRDYIREVMETLFLEVPELAGVINIFCGERFTNCWANESHVQACPRCRERSKAAVLSEVLNTFMEGIRAGSPTAEFMAWAYMVANSTESLPIAPMLEVVKATDPEVIWLGNFEHGSTKDVCGREVDVHEYSLSSLGPAENFRDLAEAVVADGREIYAKLQTGNSYELSSVPYIPVPGIVYDKVSAAAELGVTGTMLSWVVGGSPGIMLKVAGEAVFEPRPSKEELILRLAATEWGEGPAPKLALAWDYFSKAWISYPFHNAVLYWGPITRAPAYHLHLEREPRFAEPYNWGLNRKREVQPFEDQYERWLGYCTLDEMTGSLRSMARTWQDGLSLMEEALSEVGENRRLEREVAVAVAIRLQLLATANIYEFYALSDRLRDEKESESFPVVKRMCELVGDELGLTREMLRIMPVEPLIGFHSEIYAYSYSLPLLNAKMLQLEEVLKILIRWQNSGVEYEVLNRTVDEVERRRPDYDPDRWGD